jgi:hypothetical protein
VLICTKQFDEFDWRTQYSLALGKVMECMEEGYYTRGACLFVLIHPHDRIREITDWDRKPHRQSDGRGPVP